MNQAVELIVLALIFCAAAPCSIIGFYRLWCLKIDAQRRRMAPHFLNLQRSLNVCDILITYVYLVENFCLTWTRSEFFAGDAACKTLQFIQTLAFHACSNTIVCIAIDRLITVCVVRVRRRNASESKRGYVLIVVAWALAFLLSSPQCFVWGIVALPDDEEGGVLWFCTTVIHHMGNFTTEEWHLDADLLSAYMLVHTLTISIIPCVVVATCYTVICARVKSSRNRTLAGATCVELIELRPINDDHVINNNNDAVPYNNGSTVETSLSSRPESSPSADWSRRSRLEVGQSIPVTRSSTSLNVSTKNGGQNSSQGGCRKAGRMHRRRSLSYPLLLPALPARRSVRRLIGGEGPSISPSIAPVGGIRQNTMLRISAILVIVYSLCWLPYNGVILWSVLHPETFIDDGSKAKFCVFCIAIQAVANPFIYRVYDN